MKRKFGRKMFTRIIKVLREVGDEGRHQKLLFWLYIIPLNFLIPWIPLGQIFFVSKPDHWCHVSGKPKDVALERWKNLTIPMGNKTSSLSQCSKFNLTADDTQPYLNSSDFEYLRELFNATYGIVNCSSQWEYDQSNYKQTLVTQHNWVCESDEIGTSWLSMGNFGGTVGTLIFNSLSDLIGRRPVFIALIALYVLFSFLRAYSVHTWAIFFTQFICLLAFPALLEIPLILAFEQSAGSWRSMITANSFLLWTAGMCTLPLLAWLTADWFWLNFITTIPFIFFVTESPRWLLTQRKTEECHKLMVGIAKRNGKELSEGFKEKLEILAELESSKRNYGFVQLLFTPNVRRRTILLSLTYAANNLFYYGLLYNISNMSGNEFVNFFVLGITELPANLMGWWGTQNIGRRWTQSISFILATIFALATTSIAGMDDMAWLNTVLLSISKMFITTSFLVIYIQCGEIYPTTHRTCGLGFSSLITMILGLITPYIAYSGTLWPSLPYVFIGAIGVFGFVVSSLLPETLGQNLPETLADAEKFLLDWKYFSYRGRTWSEIRNNGDDNWQKNENGNVPPHYKYSECYANKALSN